MPKFSVKKPFVVLVGVIIVLVLGAVSFSKMTTDLMPNMNIPYMMIVATYPGASPEKVEKEVTDVIEQGVGTVNGVKNVTSSSSENYCTVMLEFEDDTNMDSAMVKVSAAVNQMELPDTVKNPSIMELSSDMMATLVVSVDYNGKKGVELTKYVEDKVIPTLERQDGVASVVGSGMIEKSVEVNLNQDKIDEVNGKLLEKTDSSLKKARKKIEDAQEKLDEGKTKLQEKKDDFSGQETDKSNELAKFSKMMDEAIANKAAYSSQATSLKASQTALKMEKKAYQKAKIEENYNQINQSFTAARTSISSGDGYQAIYQQIYQPVFIASVQSAADKAGMKTTVTAQNAEQILQQMGDAAEQIRKGAQEAAQKAAQEQVQKQLDTIPEDIKDALDHPDKLTAFQQMMEAQGQKDAAEKMTADNLQKIYDIVNTRLPQIDTELANLKVKIKTADAILQKMKKEIEKAEGQYEKVEAGKITAASAFGAANAQFASAEKALEDSSKELENAKDSLAKSRKEALKNANLDQMLTKDALSGILTAENFAMPAGYISDDRVDYLIKVGDEYKNVDELKNTLLTHIKGIGNVRLKDVADVGIVDNSEDTYARVNGNDAVVLSISKSSTAGTSTVSKECNAALKKMTEEDHNLHILNMMDQGDYIKLIIHSVLSNLIWGAVLAVIVLLLFLKDPRPTAVVAFSIPMSVLFAVVLMYFTNITLNVISLSGLALGVGMLVDNSIVVIENIYRLRNQGMSAARAAVKGANQVAGAIFSSTLTTICVFMPIVFTEGLTRQMMQDMCLTIAYSLTASLVVALTVVPAMSASVLKKNKDKKHRWFDAMVAGYEKLARKNLKHKVVSLLAAIILLVFCVWRITQMGIVIMPSMGSEQMTMSVDMPKENTKEEDHETAEAIQDYVKEIKGVKHIGGILSSSASMMQTSDKNYSFMVILEKKYADQNTKIADKIEKKLKTMKLKDYKVSASTMDLSGMLGSGLAVQISGKDNEKLLKISKDVMKKVGEIKGFKEISNGQEDADKEVVVTVDKDEAMKCGLTVAQIYQALSGALTTEKDATKITVDEIDYQVKIVDEREELDTNTLENFKIESTKVNDKGKSVTKKYKLSRFAKITTKNGVASLDRDNLTNQVTVTAAVDEGYNTVLLSRELKKKLDQYDLPDGYTIDFGGETESTKTMVKNMVLMILLAIIFIYLIMVAQFQSLLSPFIVIFTIPLAFTGGLIALMVSGQEISLMALMGFLILSGVVVNNGIVFVDYVNQLRLAGREKADALVEAGKTRMRPILMTAMTTILAMSTMAFNQDTSSDMGRGMAIVTIGGLAYATLMTLFIVPALYDIFYRRKPIAVDLGEDDDTEIHDTKEM